MPITYGKEMLMKSLAHIWSEYKVILILFVSIMDTKAFPSRICKPCYNVILYNFGTFIRFIFFDPKGTIFGILDPIVVVDSLI
jgi:hypothetical protein